MSDINLVDYLKKEMSAKRNSISSVLNDGLLKDMEHYKHLQGQIEMLNFVELSIQEYYKENKF
ncbi:MAG: hypothetical protein CMJ25_10430 [Phycisphaerae bacterium]|jgi:hypothetical protein|nr:hypothetical protein [Phycisphaerae bacterium]